MTVWFRLLLAELPLLRDLPDVTGRPLPRVTVALGPAVPGWVLRAAASISSTILLWREYGNSSLPRNGSVSTIHSGLSGWYP